MREILFKAKRKDNGEWIEGYYAKVKDYLTERDVHVIFPLDAELFPHGEFTGAEEIIPETVCQYTGITDKDGKKIFENDIIATRKNGTRTERLKGYYGVDSDGYPQKVPGYTGVSEYHYPCQIDCYAVVKFSKLHGFYLEGSDMFVAAICNKVAGNIYDNPEFLNNK